MLFFFPFCSGILFGLGFCRDIFILFWIFADFFLAFVFAGLDLPSEVFSCWDLSLHGSNLLSFFLDVWVFVLLFVLGVLIWGTKLPKRISYLKTLLVGTFPALLKVHPPGQSSSHK
jgi:hypothetical protein